MDMIKYDWNVLRNRIEYETIHKYSYIGALYAQLFARKEFHYYQDSKKYMYMYKYVFVCVYVFEILYLYAKIYLIIFVAITV
jgi:hypothetical protein